MVPELKQIFSDIETLHQGLVLCRSLILQGDYVKAEGLRSRLNVTYGSVQRDLAQLGIPMTFTASGRTFPIHETALQRLTGQNRYVVTNAMDFAIQGLEVALGKLARGPRKRPSRSRVAGSKRGAGVFIVHGRDHGRRDEVAAFLRLIGTSPIILGDQPAKGRTLIEKLEQEGNVKSAVIILTGDDVGAARDRASELQPRARQNVILELGYFVGRLGRENVIPLYEQGVELPTDYHGVEYVLLVGDWKIRLAKELQAAGVSVDLNKVL